MVDPEELFVIAIEDQNMVEIRRLIQRHGVNPASVKVEGIPAIHYCCLMDMLDALKIFFEEGVLDVRLRDADGDTPLHCACLSLDPSVTLLRFLVETAHSNVDAKNGYNKTPLFYACGGYDLDVVEYLVEQGGADVDAKDRRGNTPLFHACDKDSEDMVCYLARRSHSIDCKILKEAWDRGCSWDCKQVLMENFARGVLNMPLSSITTCRLHAALRTPLPNHEAFLECIDKAPSYIASVLDADETRLPLHVALVRLELKQNASLVVLKLLEKEPRAATVRDLITGFYPFEAAAQMEPRSDDNENPANLELVYTLFRYDPAHFFGVRRVVESWRDDGL